MDIIWQDLSVGTNNFDLVTLTLTFDLLFKKLKLGDNFLTERDRTLILRMDIFYGKICLNQNF